MHGDAQQFAHVVAAEPANDPAPILASGHQVAAVTGGAQPRHGYLAIQLARGRPAKRVIQPVKYNEGLHGGLRLHAAPLRASRR